jgi:tight adherence protein C
MTEGSVLAAVFTALTVGVVSAFVIRPKRRLLPRYSLYSEGSRARLGGHVALRPPASEDRHGLWRVLGPMAGSMVAPLSRVTGPRQAEIELRLRQAGLSWSSEEYHRRHLQWVIGAPVASALLGALSGSVLVALLSLVAGLAVGLRRMPDQLRSLARRRAERVRSDLPTVAAILSPKLANRKSLLAAVAEVAEEGSGPVVEDLERALALIAAGYGDQSAFALLALEAQDEPAARFYRFLAAATQGGLDLPRTLLEQADALRAQRREEVERTAARRQMSMVLPDLVFMAPVLLLFLLAPVPRLLFGA